MDESNLRTRVICGIREAYMEDEKDMWRIMIYEG